MSESEPRTENPKSKVKHKNFIYRLITVTFIIVLILFSRSAIMHQNDLRKLQNNTEKRLAEIEGIKTKTSKYKSLNLFEFLQRQKASIELSYRTALDASVPFSARLNSELAALQSKLAILQKFLIVEDGVKNVDFRILDLEELVSYSNQNKTIQKTSIFKAKYVYPEIIPKETSFLCFIEISLEPGKVDELDITVINKLRNETIKSEMIKSTPVGCIEDPSPLYAISVSLSPEDMTSDGEIILQFELPPHTQTVPYSIHDIHTHRYFWGIDHISGTLKFSSPTYIKDFGFEYETQKFIDDATKQDIHLTGRDGFIKLDSPQLIVHYEVKENTSSPIIIAFLGLSPPRITK